MDWFFNNVSVTSQCEVTWFSDEDKNRINRLVLDYWDYEIRRNNPNLKTFSICLGPSPIINILTSGLPGNVTRPIYLEYNSRKR